MGRAEVRADEELESMLSDGDDLTATIRGHLWIDFLLNTTLEAALERPDEAALDGMRFPQRVDLAIAMGALPRELEATCMAVNWLRNRFAHNLDFELDDDVARRLRESLPETTRGAKYPWPVEDETPRQAMVRCFLTAIIGLQHAISGVRDAKAQEQAFYKALIAAADRTLPPGQTSTEFIAQAVEADGTGASLRGGCRGSR